MEETFKNKFEELFDDMEEKLEDILHSCLLKKFGEDNLDKFDGYGRLLSKRTDDIKFDFKDLIESELFYLEDDIMFEIGGDDWELPEEAQGTPWEITEEKEEEEKDLDDL